MSNQQGCLRRVAHPARGAARGRRISLHTKEGYDGYVQKHIRTFVITVGMAGAVATTHVNPGAAPACQERQSGSRLVLYESRSAIVRALTIGPGSARVPHFLEPTANGDPLAGRIMTRADAHYPAGLHCRFAYRSMDTLRRSGQWSESLTPARMLCAAICIKISPPSEAAAFCTARP
jgi:hypothetical protein